MTITCQLNGLLFGAKGLIVRVGPEEKRTCTLLATMMVVVMELAMILEMVTMKVMMKLAMTVVTVVTVMFLPMNTLIRAVVVMIPGWSQEPRQERRQDLSLWQAWNEAFRSWTKF